MYFLSVLEIQFEKVSTYILKGKIRRKYLIQNSKIKRTTLTTTPKYFYVHYKKYYRIQKAR